MAQTLAAFHVRASGAIALRRRAAALFGLLALIVSPGSTAWGAEDPYDGNWHFALTPYLWLPSVDGTLRFDAPDGSSGSANLDMSAGAILEDLDFAFMGTGDVRKGNWVAFTDFIYLDLSNDTATVRSITGPGGLIEIPVNTSTHSSLRGYVWTVAAGYALVRGPSATLDVLVGFRDLQLKADLDWQFAGPLQLFPQSGSLSQTSVIWDALIAAKGKIRLSESGSWYLPYYVDIGTGSSSFTWQGLVGVAYAFSWGDLSLSYRYLYYNTDGGRLIDDISLSGPALGATFHF
jgi:hypothetical protein